MAKALKLVVTTPRTLTEAIRVAGDVVAGNLLAQITYWYQPDRFGKTKLRVHRNGVAWIAKTRTAWIGETGLTVAQYRRAISVLKAKGLIETRVFKFAGNPITHLRLLRSIWSFSPEPFGDDHQIHLAKITTSFTETTTESTTDSTGGEDPASRADGAEYNGRKIGGEDGDKGVRSVGEEKEVGEVEAVEEDNDILSALRDSRPTTPKGSCTVEPDSVTMDPEPEMRAEDILKRPRTSPPNGALGAFWQRQVTDAFGGHQKPLTGQERGQLALIAKGLGPARAREVIAGTVAKWGKFATRVAHARATSSPPTPHIGFLLKHYDLAVDLLAEQTLVPPGADVGTSVQLSAAPMIPTPAPAETPYKLSDAEFAEIMKGFEK